MDLDAKQVMEKLSAGWRLFWTYKGPVTLESPKGGTRRVAQATFDQLLKSYEITHGWYEDKRFCWVPRPNFYYQSIPRRVEDMTKEQLEQECESFEDTFNSYRSIGQGISTKEGCRYRACMARLEAVFGVFRPYWN